MTPRVPRTPRKHLGRSRGIRAKTGVNTTGAGARERDKNSAQSTRVAGSAICWLFRGGPILSARIVNEARYAYQACQR